MPSTDHDHPALADLIAESHACEQSGDISTALKRAHQALELARSGGMPEDIAAALVCVALYQYHLGHFDQAKTMAGEALTITLPDSRTCAEALRILGNCAHEAGDLPAADNFFHRAIDIARSQGYRRMLQSCLHSLSACVYQPRGQFELALAADQEALRLALELDLRDLVWFSLEMIGWIYWVTGHHKQAQGIADQMREYVPPGSMAEGYYLCLCGDLALDGENPTSACELLAQARSIAEKIGDPGLNAEVRLSLSRCQRALGNAPAAYRWAEDALSTAQRAGSADLQGQALIERARAAWVGGDLSGAEADLKAAIDILSPIQADYDLARISFYLACAVSPAGATWRRIPPGWKQSSASPSAATPFC